MQEPTRILLIAGVPKPSCAHLCHGRCLKTFLEDLQHPGFPLLIHAARTVDDGATDVAGTLNPDLVLFCVQGSADPTEAIYRIRRSNPVVPLVALAPEGEDVATELTTRRAGADGYVRLEEFKKHPLEVVRDGLFRRPVPDIHPLSLNDLEMLGRRLASYRLARDHLRAAESEIDRFATLMRDRDAFAAELASIFRAFPDFCVRIDRNKRVMRTYGGNMRALGSPSPGSQIRDCLPSDIAATVEKAVDEANGVRNLEYQLTLDGVAHWFEMRICRIIESNDVLAVVRDITERHDERVRYRTLFELTPAVIVGVTKDLQIIEWNHAAEQLYGVSRDAAIGTNYERFLPAEERDRSWVEVDRILTLGRTSGFVNEVIAATGKRVKIQWNCGVCPYGILAAGIPVDT